MVVIIGEKIFDRLYRSIGLWFFSYDDHRSNRCFLPSIDYRYRSNRYFFYHRCPTMALTIGKRWLRRNLLPGDQQLLWSAEFCTSWYLLPGSSTVSSSRPQHVTTYHMVQSIQIKQNFTPPCPKKILVAPIRMGDKFQYIHYEPFHAIFMFKKLPVFAL
jgi:hypothetical protein